MDNVRVDDGIEEGMEVPIYYDPMLAKLIAWGETREEASRRLVDAIDNFEIEGVATTLPFGKFVLQHEAFINGNFDTHFVKHYFTPDKLDNTEEAEVAATLAVKLFLEHKKQLVVLQVEVSEWYQNR